MDDCGSAPYRFQLLADDEYRDWHEGSASPRPPHSPFHHPAWLTAVSQGLDRQLVTVSVHSGDRLLAMIPGFMERRGPVRLFGSPLRGTMTSYLGPAMVDTAPDNAAAQIAEAALGFARSELGARYVRFTLRNAPESELPEMSGGWRQQRPKSYRLDLTEGVDAVWNGLTSDCRRNIRRAEREGVEIVRLEDPRVFYRLLDATLRRHGSTSFHPLRFFESLFDEPVQAGILQPLAASYQGSIVSAGIFLRDRNELHYLSGASDPEFGSLPTSYGLHWHAIRDAIANGTLVFNSDASRIRSIDRFKESFRPRLERRHTVIWAPKPVYLAQKRGIAIYHRYRSVRARLGGRRS